MNKQAKIKEVVKITGVTDEIAEAHLEAEEWIVSEAVFDIHAERKAGILQ